MSLDLSQYFEMFYHSLSGGLRAMMQSEFPALPPQNRNVLLRVVVYVIAFFFLSFMVILIALSFLLQLIGMILDIIAFCIFWLLGRIAGLLGFIGINSARLWNFFFSSFLPICILCGLPITNRFPGKRQQCCGAIAHDGCHDRKNSGKPLISINLFFRKENKK